MATLQRLGDEFKCLLDRVQMRIGRASDNEIIVNDETVSSYHALITIRPAQQNDKIREYILEDLNSTNQTFVNNKSVARHLLQEGDIIRVGNTRLKFSTKRYISPNKKYQQTQKLNPQQTFCQNKVSKLFQYGYKPVARQLTAMCCEYRCLGL